MKLVKIIKIILSFIVLSFLVAFFALLIFLFINRDTKPLTEQTTTQTTTETEYVYVICDVVDSYETQETQDDIYTTNIVCEMPNGELHIYAIEDAPEGIIELVCFRTDNQDVYETYEVVGVR